MSFPSQNTPKSMSARGGEEGEREMGREGKGRSWGEWRLGCWGDRSDAPDWPSLLTLLDELIFRMQCHKLIMYYDHLHTVKTFALARHVHFL